MENAGDALIYLLILHVMMLMAPCICQFPHADNNSVPAHKCPGPGYGAWIYGDPETLVRLHKQIFR